MDFASVWFWAVCVCVHMLEFCFVSTLDDLFTARWVPTWTPTTDIAQPRMSVEQTSRLQREARRGLKFSVLCGSEPRAQVGQRTAGTLSFGVCGCGWLSHCRRSATPYCKELTTHVRTLQEEHINSRKAQCSSIAVVLPHQRECSLSVRSPDARKLQRVLESA